MANPFCKFSQLHFFGLGPDQNDVNISALAMKSGLAEERSICCIKSEAGAVGQWFDAGLNIGR